MYSLDLWMQARKSYSDFFNTEKKYLIMFTNGIQLICLFAPFSELNSILLPISEATLSSCK